MPVFRTALDRSSAPVIALKAIEKGSKHLTQITLHKDHDSEILCALDHESMLALCDALSNSAYGKDGWLRKGLQIDNPAETLEYKLQQIANNSFASLEEQAATKALLIKQGAGKENTVAALYAPPDIPLPMPKHGAVPVETVAPAFGEDVTFSEDPHFEDTEINS